MSATRHPWIEVLGAADAEMLIDLALREDLGAGDLTTDAIFTGATPVHAAIVARSDTVMCGGPVAETVFRRIDPDLQITCEAAEGELVPGGGVLLGLRGDARGILKGERCALNFLMRLCGIATATRRAVDAVPPGARARIFDTRKTVPGWRRFDKAAVRVGGGENHRAGLFDAVLIKDNHVAAAGSVREAIERARARLPSGVVIEVEIDRLEQLEEALSARPDIILLDNMSVEDMHTAVERTGGRAVLEASGGVTPARIAEIARTGVDRISIGSLTHTVVPADLSLELPAPEPPRLISLDEVDSTMEEARRAFTAGAAEDGEEPREGLTVVAHAQRAGRGRLGRQWISPAGAGVWMTTVLCPPAELAPYVGFAAALAVLEVVHRLGATSVRLKWPNDLVVPDGDDRFDRKLCGILVQAQSGSEVVLVGIGLNLLPVRDVELPDDVRGRWLGLCDLVDSPPNAAVLAPRVAYQLMQRYRDLQQHGFGPIRHGWQRWDALFGQRVRAEAPESIEGVADGIDETGALRLRVGDSVRRVTSGEVLKITVPGRVPPDDR